MEIEGCCYKIRSICTLRVIKSTTSNMQGYMKTHFR